MNNAEVAYSELKSLLDFLNAFAAAKSDVLHEAEIALQGNSGNPTALDALANNLRSVRADIVSGLKAQLK